MKCPKCNSELEKHPIQKIIGMVRIKVVGYYWLCMNRNCDYQENENM